MNKLNLRRRGVRLVDSDVRARRWSKWRRWVWLSLLGLGLLLVIGWLVQDRFLTIKHTYVDQQVRVSPAVVPITVIQQVVAKQKGHWLWLDTQALSRQLTQQFPSLASAQVDIRFPDTLNVELLPRVAFCQLVTPSGVFLVDRQGFIFATLPQPLAMLPQLKTSLKPTVGRQISTNGLQLGLQLITTFRSSSPPLTQIDLHDGQLDVQFAGPPLVMIADTQPANVVLPQLVVLLREFATTGKVPAVVDMRYDRPVLRW